MNHRSLDAALNSLRETQPPGLPRGFRASVWSEIETRRAGVAAPGWLDAWLHTSLRPAGIAIVLTVSLLVGFGFPEPAEAAPLGLEVFSSRAHPLTQHP